VGRCWEERCCLAYLAMHPYPFAWILMGGRQVGTPPRRLVGKPFLKARLGGDACGWLIWRDTNGIRIPRVPPVGAETHT
jgi:hypothetical protein